MTVPARDVMLRIERPIERPEAADEEESPCPPPERELLLSMFRVLKDLHLYCERARRAGEKVVDALSMHRRLHRARDAARDRRPAEGRLCAASRVQTSPLAARGGGGDASVLSSPASLSCRRAACASAATRRASSVARQEQLQEAAKYFSLGQRVTLAPARAPTARTCAGRRGREPAAASSRSSSR